MKKTLAVLLALAAVVVLLTACSGSVPDELKGTWKITSAEVMGTTVTMETLQSFGMNVNMTVKFVDDKTVEITSAVGEVKTTDKYAYTYKNNVVSLDAGLNFEYSNKTLRLDADTAILIFEK